MSSSSSRRVDFKKVRQNKRKPIQVSSEKMVEVTPLSPDQDLLLVVQPAIAGVNLLSWAANNSDFIETHLFKHGGLLFRNFEIETVPEFEAFVEATTQAGLLEYTYRSTPRSQVSGNIYTSTEYPAEQFIPLHNEMSYTRSWPLKIWFLCVQAAQEGGETPIADSRKVFTRISPETRERFAQKQVRYIRNYGAGLDLSWQTVFQTSDKSAVEAYCHENGLIFEWRGPDRLRTYQVCQAVARHPKTGDTVWFNQAHLFHPSSLGEEAYRTLLTEFAEEDLPRHVSYGDGSPIEAETLAEIRQAYQQEMVSFPWQKGDIMMLDNMLTAHARNPFVGPRQIIVGMAEPVHD